MTHKTLKHLAAIAIVCATASSVTSAVGNGLPFVVDEDAVPGAIARTHNSNSLDFTYHSCVDFIQPPGQPPQFRESGYFWVSSYQNLTSVVDSQINYFDVNGYRIYAKYRYEAAVRQPPQPVAVRPASELRGAAATGSRSSCISTGSRIPCSICRSARLWQSAVTTTTCLIGSSTTLDLGEKSEATNVAANGDFELRFGNWTFTNFGAELFQFPQPAAFYRLVVNANITRLIGGALNTDHRAEGSGNLFWWSD